MTSPRPTTPYERGLAFLKQGKYAEAVAEFTEAIRLEAGAPNAYVGRALAYRSLGDEDSARRDEQAARTRGGSETTAWDRLVNRAYQRLKGDLRQASREEFYRRLDPLPRRAVLLRELNAQVFNGGIPQWVTNGYAAFIDQVIDAARQVDTDAARQVAAILEDVAQVLEGWPGEAAPSDDATLDRLLECDGRYFDVQARFVQDVEAWLEREAPGRG